MARSRCGKTTVQLASRGCQCWLVSTSHWGLGFKFRAGLGLTLLMYDPLSLRINQALNVRDWWSSGLQMLACVLHSWAWFREWDFGLYQYIARYTSCNVDKSIEDIRIRLASLKSLLRHYEYTHSACHRCLLPRRRHRSPMSTRYHIVQSRHITVCRPLVNRLAINGWCPYSFATS